MQEKCYDATFDGWDTVSQELSPRDWDLAVLGDAFVPRRLRDRGYWSGQEGGEPLRGTVAIALALAQEDGGDKRVLEGMPNETPLLRALKRHIEGSPELELLPRDDAGTAWVSLSRFPVSGAMSPLFEETIWRLLDALPVGGWFQEPRRRYLVNLLFHPLQNARQHARRDPNGTPAPLGFSGMACQVTERPLVTSPAAREYLRSKASEGQRYLELVIHDDGCGIAEHFRRSRGPGTTPPLSEGPVGAEFLWLKYAFERHASSKLLERAEREFTPGVGLWAMLAALRAVGALLEVRTGRIAAHRYFEPSEQLKSASLLLPEAIAESGINLRGTILRLLIPRFI